MSKIPTRMQVSAGGVAFRRDDGQVEIALIGVGEDNRWQLPKGLVNPNEEPEDAAIREVREEAGVHTTMLAPIDTIEYWYYGGRVRFHKYVHFYLFEYQSGSVTDHDHEVNEARWVGIDDAQEMLAFKNEKEVVEKAKAMIAALT